MQLENEFEQSAASICEKCVNVRVNSHCEERRVTGASEDSENALPFELLEGLLAEHVPLRVLALLLRSHSHRRTSFIQSAVTRIPIDTNCKQ